MSVPEEASRVLEYLRAHHWVKGDYAVGNGGACLAVAINLLAGENRAGVHRAVVKVIKQEFPERLRGGLIGVFNDHCDTTFADVEMVLEKVAAL